MDIADLDGHRAFNQHMRSLALGQAGRRRAPQDSARTTRAHRSVGLRHNNAASHLSAGDLVAIPSGRPHAIQLPSERARLVDSFNPVREDFLK
jgi:hypothetical protein